MKTDSYARDAIDAIKSNDQHGRPELKKYLKKFSNDIKNFPDLKLEGYLSYQNHIKPLIDHIKKFMPMVNEFIDVINNVSEYSENIRIYRIIHRFFSDLTDYFYLSSDINISKDLGRNFISYILFTTTIASFIREERWEALSIFFNEEYQATESDNPTSYTFSIFYQKEDAFWKQYWKEQNRTPNYPIASFLQENLPDGIKPSDIAQADAIIYIAHQIRKMKKDPAKVLSEYWIPECFCYFMNNKSSLPIFVHASSRKYFQNLLPILSVDSVKDFRDRFDRILKESNTFSPENNDQFKYRLGKNIPFDKIGINP